MDDSAFRCAPLGLSFLAPGPRWKKKISSSGESLTVSFTDSENPSRIVYLTLWELRSPLKPEEYRDSTLAHHKRESQAAEVSRGEREIAGRPAATIRCRDPHYVSDACYFERDGVFYSLVAYAPLTEEKNLSVLAEGVIGGLRWSKPRASGPKKKPGAVVIGGKEKGHVVTVVHAQGPEAAYQYLEALPGAALANGGRPVILVVADEVGASARAFLRKFRPEKIRLVGSAMPELPQARPAIDRWKRGGTVVISERSLKHAVPAAAEAARLKAPFLVADQDLAARLSKLSPKRVLVAGNVPLAGAEPLRAGPGRYAALCNVADGKECVFAAALAATHGGMVIAIDKPVRWHEGRLNAQGEGEIALGGKAVKVAAPIIGKLSLTTKYEAPRFGHPKIELNGKFETPAIGSSVRVGGKRYMFSARFAMPSGAMITGHDNKGSVFLLEPDPNEIREELRAKLPDGAEFLAIVGSPKSVPFFYLECKSYFEGYALNQEVPSDLPYALGGDDDPVGLAVGRLLPDGLENGSATIATTIAYPQLTGAWKSRATIIQPGFAKKEIETGYQWVLPEGEALLRGVSADLALAGIARDEFFREKVDATAAVSSLAKSGWVCFHNHSDQREWGIHPESKIVPKWKNRVLREPPAGTRELPELEGAPIVFCGGCGSAGVDVGIPPDETHPERFFQLGAVAYVGNTRTASAGAEYGVKLFFDRMLFDGATLGEAFRDGRNFLFHLLKMRHINPNFEDWLQDPIMYDVVWEQYYNMNLFGDPALRPAVPAPARRPVSVSLKGGTLVVKRRAPERIDAVQFMPMFAKGAPRDTCLRTGPGLTFCDVPMTYLDRENGLSPLRTEPKAPPGAWVDLALPHGAGGVKVRLKSGPKWADRGFAVERGLKGEPRLQMFVPLAYSTLEAGEGETAARVVFDVSYTRGGATAPSRRGRVLDTLKWVEKGSSPGGIVTEAAKTVCDALERLKYSPVKDGLRLLEMIISCPTSRDFRGTRFRALWRKGKGVEVSAIDLPAQWGSWKKSILHGLRGFVERTILNGEGAPASFQSYHVDVERKDAKETVLAYRPAASREGNELILCHVSTDGLLRKERRRRFGVWFSTEYEWRDVGPGVLVSKVKLSDIGMAVAEVSYEYEKINEFHLLTTMTSATPGYMPPSLYRVEYRRALRTG